MTDVSDMFRKTEKGNMKDMKIIQAIPNGIGNQYQITFSNREMLKGDAPFSMCPFYEYDVYYTTPEKSIGIIDKMIARRLPLNLKLLIQIVEYCGTDIDMEEFIYSHDPEFDISETEVDQIETFKRQHSDLVEKIQEHWDGLCYFNFREIKAISRCYDRDTLKSLDIQSMLLMVDMIKKNPFRLCFDIFLPNPIIPEIDLESLQKICEITDYDLTIEMVNGIELYKKFISRELENGHLFSKENYLSRNTPYYHDSISWLEEIGVVMISDGEIFLKKVLSWEASIKRSISTLKERFCSIQYRDNENDPYENRDKLKVLTTDQKGALFLLDDNHFANLCGMAGTVRDVSFMLSSSSIDMI